MGGIGDIKGKIKNTPSTVYDYYLDLTIGIANGPIDRLRELMIKDKSVYKHVADGDFTTLVNQPNLFGGDDAEGGVSGTLRFQQGRSDQPLDPTIGSPVPYRKLAVLRFGNWKWGTNNPYLPKWAVQITNLPRRLGPTYAELPPPRNYADPSDSNTDGTTNQDVFTPGPQANPAHVIYELLVDETWGARVPATLINSASFMACAETLFNEGMGVSFLWKDQVSISKAIEDVLKHIDGVLYIDRQTGQYNLSLFRDDYDASTLPELTGDNSKILKFSRKTWGETVNELTVRFTNPVTGENDSITLHDHGNIAIQGFVIHETEDLPGFQDSELAARVGAKLLRERAYPLASAEVEVSRELWGVHPGSLVRLTSPEDKVERLVMRVMSVDYGKVGRPALRLNLVEDVFAFQVDNYVGYQDYKPPATGSPPAPPTAELYLSAPYYFIAQSSAATQDDADRWPSAPSLILHDYAEEDHFETKIYAQQSTSTGTTVWAVRGAVGKAAYGALADPLAVEAMSILDLSTTFGPGALPQVGDFIIVGDSESNHEILHVRAITGSTATVARGVLDTIPQQWPAGTPAWGDTDYALPYVDTGQSAGGSHPIEIEPTTAGGTLSPRLPRTLSLTDRSYRPLRPAGMTLAGTTWPASASSTVNADVNVTWANRDRKAEDPVVLTWTDGTIPPEPGQQTVVQVYRGATLVHSWASTPGATVSSYTIPGSVFAQADQYRVVIYSRFQFTDTTHPAHGLVSLKSVEQLIDVA